MKLLIEKLRPVKEALLSVSNNVGLHEAIDATKAHIVYAPDSEATSILLDNRKSGQVIQGTIDLYVKESERSLADDVQEALNAAGISFSLNSIQFEEIERNNLLHYEWVFEVD